MSRQRSAVRGGDRAARAARPAGARGVYVQAPRSDVYVAMLGVALGAIILGCILLILRLNDYEFKTKPTAMLPAAPAVLAALVENPGDFPTVRL